jgi:hypothetical protein
VLHKILGEQTAGMIVEYPRPISCVRQLTQIQLSSSKWLATPALSRVGHFPVQTPKMFKASCHAATTSSLLPRMRRASLSGPVWTFHHDPPLLISDNGVALPEITIAVTLAIRGNGVGSALLDELFVRCTGSTTCSA